GRGGYEGMQADNLGNLIIVEDIGGTRGTRYPNARRPNSFLYRFIPANPYNLNAGGKLQVLQVTGRSGRPIVFNNNVDDSIINQDMLDLHVSAGFQHEMGDDPRHGEGWIYSFRRRSVSEGRDGRHAIQTA